MVPQHIVQRKTRSLIYATPLDREREREREPSEEREFLPRLVRGSIGREEIGEDRDEYR